MKVLTWLFVGAAALLACGMGLALWLGGPARPPAMREISDAFRAVDYSAVPPPAYFMGRDATRLAYRRYAPRNPQQAARGSVVLVHGSSATSQSMHLAAQALADAGWTAYALDIRGHGESGGKGHIAYIGQLEDDLAEFVQQVAPPAPRTLAGFSSGGGFVLRVAAGDMQGAFHSFVLLSPFLHQSSAAYREDSGGWVRVGVPRLLALQMLNLAGLRAFNHLAVTRFAIDDASRKLLTESYDFNLAANFRPQADYLGAISRVSRPVIVMAGTLDEAFHTDRFADIFAGCPGLVEVTLLPGIGHAGLVLEPAAIRQLVGAVGKLQARSR